MISQRLLHSQQPPLVYSARYFLRKKANSRIIIDSVLIWLYNIVIDLFELNNILCITLHFAAF